MGNSSLQSFRAFLHSYHCSSERSQLLFWFYVFPFLCFFSYLFIYLFPHFFSPVSVSVDVREQVRVLQMVSRGVLLLLRAIQGRSFEFRAMPFLSWRLFFFFSPFALMEKGEWAFHLFIPPPLATLNPNPDLSLPTQWSSENWTWDNCVAISHFGCNGISRRSFGPWAIRHFGDWPSCCSFSFFSFFFWLLFP